MKRFHLFILFVSAFLMGACNTAERSEKRGNAAMSLGEYAEAANLYKAAYQMTSPKDRKNRGRRAFLMADSYRRFGNSARALGAYQNAVRYKYEDTLQLFYLGEMQRLQSDYKGAEKSYLTFLEEHPNNVLALRALEAAREALSTQEEGLEYTVGAAGIFNGSRSDYSPMYFGAENNQLFFTTTRREVKGNELSGVTAQLPGDIWVAKKDEKGNWKRPEPVEGGINTNFDEGTCAFTPDGSVMYLTICRTDPQHPRMAEIWSSNRSDASWSKPQIVAITKDTLSSYAHPAVSPDGHWLYFTSDMPGGYGGTDIWRVPLTSHGLGAVENLGNEINTPGNEAFPTFRPNGDLYFSSDGHGGLGGLDIYRARLDTASNYWLIQTLPAPVNSHGDDFGMTFEGNHTRGYFSSNRATGGRGWDKIYSFSFPDTRNTIKGWVYEQDGYELPAAQVHMVGSDGTNQKVNLLSDGSFEQEVKRGVDYIFLASCKGFLNVPNTLPKDSIQGQGKEYVLQFPMPSMTVPVIVRNVFYQFDKATLTKNSVEALDRLVKLLEENPNITIELAAHTDSRGNDAYNNLLSQRRAENVVRYLREHGIAADRLTPKGYGKNRPIVVSKKLTETYPFLHTKETLDAKFIAKLTPEQQEICHGLNRRTTFRVLRTTYNLFDAKGNLKKDALPKPPKKEDPLKEGDYIYIED